LTSRRKASRMSTNVGPTPTLFCLKANLRLGQPVAVEALLVFDNVGTIGVPRTGVLRPLNFFKPQKNPGFDGRLRGDSE
jgi:hypothetical protein